MGCALGYLGLQSELQAAHKESELLRQKLRYFEDEMSRVRDRNSELVDEINSKSGKRTNIGTSVHSCLFYIYLCL